MENFDKQFAAFMVKLQEAVNADYRITGYTARPPVLGFERGKRYIRIVSESGGQRSAFGFVDTTNGNVLKSAGWKAPATNFARGNIFDDKTGTGRIRWTGIQ